MKLTKAAAGVGALTLALGTLLVGFGVGTAQASSQAFHLYGQINYNALSGNQDLGANQNVAMTISPATVPPGAQVEIKVTSSNMPICNGPAAAPNAFAEELDAAVIFNGTQYLLRGPQNTSTVPISPNPPNAPACTHSLFDPGWVVSSFAGDSSAKTNNNDSTATKGKGATVLNTTTGKPGSPIDLKAPATPGAYDVKLKGLVVNSLGDVNTDGAAYPKDTVYGQFDEFINIDSTAACKRPSTCPVDGDAVTAAGPGGIADKAVTPDPGVPGSFYLNDTTKYITFTTPVSVTVDPNATAAPTRTASQSADPTASKTTAAATSKAPSVNNDPRSKTATVSPVYCQVYNTGVQPTPDKYTNWKLKITVSPGAAKPGSKVNVTVANYNSPNNGPATELDPGSYRFEATIKFEGKKVQLTGPTNKASVPISKPIFASSQLPTIAGGSITLPDAEGDYPISISNIVYNNVAGSGTAASYTDLFDNSCNTSSKPQAAPKAFAAPVVNVSADNNAGGGATSPAENADVLAATGGREVLIVGLLALLALQLGAVFTVRAYRASPRGPRHL